MPAPCRPFIRPNAGVRACVGLLAGFLVCVTVTKAARHAPVLRLPPLACGEMLVTARQLPGAGDESEPLSINEGSPWENLACQCDQGKDGYCWQLLPPGLIFQSYLAGEKESRFRSFWTYEKDNGWIWDITLGGRVGILRYGATGDRPPEGFQLDIEGAGIPRLDLEEDRDVDSADFRFGIPLTIGTERYQMKLAYYHLSSHLGDEFLLKHPAFPRLNYSRDVLVWGHSFTPTERMRYYAEAGWAFASDVGEPWEFQFGVEYRPLNPTGLAGEPFAACGVHLREEVDFGGNIVFQAGWAWRGSPTSGLLRAGVEYFNGKSDQFSFFDEHESKVGLALWYDF